MALCLICCSEVITEEKNGDNLSTNLSVIFLLKNLLQVPDSQLKNNLEKFGNPQDWIQLCHQCSELTRQAEKMYCEIVKMEIELKKVHKLIIDNARSSFVSVGSISNHDDDDDNDLEEYGKRNQIWEETRRFTKNYNYSRFTNTVNPFPEKDERAALLAYQRIKIYNETILPDDQDNHFDDFDETMSDVDSEKSDKPELKFDIEDKPPKKRRTKKNEKSSKKWVPVKRPTFDGKYKCKFCDKLFEKRGTCTAHEAQKHASKEIQLICDICGKAWNNAKSLTSHRWGVHRVTIDGTALPPLPKPTKFSRPRRTDKVYKRLINIEGKWKCRNCDKLFGSKSACYSHEASKHTTTPGSFVCHICGKAWNSIHDLTKHRWGSHKIRKDGTPVPNKPKIVEPQVCNLCGKIFSSKKSVKNHIRYVHFKKNEIGKQKIK